MTAPQTQKRQAIDLHSAQAELFASRYSSPNLETYRDCFTYSRHRLRQLLDRYLPQQGDGASVLDVGCGTGHFLSELRSRGYEVSGVDGSAEMLVHARGLNPSCEIHQADVEALPFAKASFDYVVCVEVLRYLPEPYPCIAEMARVLKPGGVCLATAAPLFNLNGYWLINRLAPMLRFVNLVRLRQFFTTSGSLRRQFVQAGFGNVGVHGVYFGPVNWFGRLVPQVLPRLLQNWERLDEALADQENLRELSNMFLVHATRRG
jgi:ubiquinone/menaquinone biosynthesis C-methylase UbiE